MGDTRHDEPAVRITPLNPAADPARVIISPVAPFAQHDNEAAVAAAWAALRRENPRLHDGPILAVAHIDPATNLLVCRRDSYRRLAVQTAGGGPAAASVDTGVYQLSVTGAIIGRDRAGLPHILIGRRGTETRMYGGLWELAPAGGIDPPPPPRDRLGASDIFAALAKEAREELALDLGTDPCRAALICRDEHARSDDLVIPVHLPDPINPRKPPACAASTSWEYLDTAWLALDDARSFVTRHAEACIPPTRALLASTRWLSL